MKNFLAYTLQPPRHRPHRHLPARAARPRRADRGDGRRDRRAGQGRLRPPHRPVRGRRRDDPPGRTPCIPIADLQIEYSLISRGIEDRDPARPAASWASASPRTACSRAACSAATGRTDRQPARGDFRAISPRFQGENLDRNLALVEALRGDRRAEGRHASPRSPSPGCCRAGARHRAAGRRAPPRPADRGAGRAGGRR